MFSALLPLFWGGIGNESVIMGLKREHKVIGQVKGLTDVGELFGVQVVSIGSEGKPINEPSGLKDLRDFCGTESCIVVHCHEFSQRTYRLTG